MRPPGESFARFPSFIKWVPACQGQVNSKLKCLIRYQLTRLVGVWSWKKCSRSWGPWDGRVSPEEFGVLLDFAPSDGDDPSLTKPTPSVLSPPQTSPRIPINMENLYHNNNIYQKWIHSCASCNSWLDLLSKHFINLALKEFIIFRWRHRHSLFLYSKLDHITCWWEAETVNFKAIHHGGRRWCSADRTF